MKANGTINGYPAYQDDEGNTSQGPHVVCPDCDKHDCFNHDHMSEAQRAHNRSAARAMAEDDGQNK